MAITFGTNQTGSSKTAGTSVAASAITSGSLALNDLIVVIFASDDAAGTYSCADDQLNSYQTDLARTSNAGHCSVVIFSAIVATVANTIVTVTHPSLTARGIDVYTFRGADTTASRVDTAAVTATGTGNAGSGNYTTAFSGSVMIGASVYESDRTNTYGGDANFVSGGAVGTTGGADASNITTKNGYQILSGTATDAYDTTNSASRSWVAALLAYKAPAAVLPARPLLVKLRAVPRASSF